MKKWTLVNFLTDPLDRRSRLWSADVMLYRWVGGKHACVDIIGASPLVGLGVDFYDRTNSSKSCVKTKWSNMRNRVLTIKTFLYHLFSTLSIS